VRVFNEPNFREKFFKACEVNQVGGSAFIISELLNLRKRDMVTTDDLKDLVNKMVNGNNESLHFNISEGGLNEGRNLVYRAENGNPKPSVDEYLNYISNSIFQSTGMYSTVWDTMRNNGVNV